MTRPPGLGEDRCLRTRNGIRVGILGLIATATITPGVAVAADFTVTTTADGDDKECVEDCTLREAVVLAGSADRVLVPSGNYVLTGGELSLNNDTIIGEDARKTVIDGDRKSRVLRVIEVQSRVSNVTIRNGNGVGLDPDGIGGGIFIHSGSLVLQNSTVSGNTGIMGAGIAASGTAQLVGVTVSGNVASTGRLTRGGGIAVDATGGLLIGNSTVSGNTAVDDVGAASQGGGIYSAGALAVIASTIANNSAAEGGGLYVVATQTGTPLLQNSLISHGTGGACGGPGLGNLNATFNVASDDSCQLKDPSNLGSVNPQIGALADNGGPTNTHALQPTSPAIHHAGGCATLDQRGFSRVAPCDSGAYEYRAPTLNVVMQVVNDSGGSFSPSRFSVHVRSAGGDVSGSPQPGSASGTSYTLAAGNTYTVAADAVAGYALSVSGDCAPNGSITLQEGQARTCTITADDIAPTLQVITNVVNNDGGTLGPANFAAHVRTGGFDVAGSPQAGSATGTVYTVSAGPTYTVSADAVAGYSLAVTGACATNGNVTLVLGQTATCTITATDNPPTLRVITNVVNDNGGNRVAADFTAHVRTNGVDVTGSPQPGTGAGTDYTLSAGSYTVAADAVTGYSFAITGDCAVNGTITLALGQARTCTITANDVAPTLRVITTVVNDNGGARPPSGFIVHVRANGNDIPTSPQAGDANGTTYTVSAGQQYTVAADAVTDYTFVISGSCAASGTVTPQVGQNLTCTITVDDIPATLRVVTNVVNNSGGSAERDDFFAHVKRNGADVATSPQLGAAAPGTEYRLATGTYELSADGESGYSAAFSAACAGGTIDLALADEATCTITLEDGAATLNVVTRVVNDDGGTVGADAFSVSVLLGEDDVPTSPQPGSENGTPYTLNAATYTVATDGVPGYTYSVTGDCAPDGSITLPLDAERACTVIADDVAPRLTVVTQVVNDHGGAAAPSSFTVHVRRGGTDVSGSPQPGSGSGTAYTLSAGTHVVSADAVSGYGSATSGDCAGDGSITLSVGDDRTCTVTANDDPPPVQAQGSQQPPPEPGKSVNALPKSGTVKVKLPGSAAYVNLDEAQQLPVGTVVDATRGHVTLIAAADDSGGTATAEFWAGIFEIGQTKGKAPTTILTLVGKLSCPRSGKASVAAKKKKKRRLWGNGSGKFRTKGKHSAATVVGTRWLVEDRCKSTLTRVVRGRVSVRDFVKKKTVTLRAGKKYVAKARRR